MWHCSIESPEGDRLLTPPVSCPASTFSIASHPLQIWETSRRSCFPCTLPTPFPPKILTPLSPNQPSCNITTQPRPFAPRLSSRRMRSVTSLPGLSSSLHSFRSAFSVHIIERFAFLQSSFWVLFSYTTLVFNSTTNHNIQQHLTSRSQEDIERNS